VLMVPLLTVYADLMGMLGGAAIGASMLDVSLKVYFNQLQEALTLKYCAQGLIKSAVYGVIIALAGCMRGMQSGRSGGHEHRRYYRGVSHADRYLPPGVVVGVTCPPVIPTQTLPLREKSEPGDVSPVEYI
jgi:hypothetical protein